MTPVRKKRTAKLDLWVQGLGYLLGRYLMRGSTRLEIQSLLVHWIHYRIWVEDQSIPPPPPSGYMDDKTHAILVDEGEMTKTCQSAPNLDGLQPAPTELKFLWRP
uniref:Uncharacterized protein n=1 Tax=Vitis vinifera TaxID=29760 RepID=F6HQN2_VITVI